MEESQLALGIGKTAKLLDISKDSTRRAIARGDLEIIRVGRRVLVLRASIERLLRQEKK